VGIDAVNRRAVFLDRDGVINRAIMRDGKPASPRTLEEFEFVPDVFASVERLRAAGFYLAVVTNQPELTRGVASWAVVADMCALVEERLGIGDIRVCPHEDRDGCRCRKPKPGMLLDAARDANLDLARSFMVGDRWRDIGAGRAAGCRTVLIDYHYGEPDYIQPDFAASSLTAAVDWIVAIT
jgi:D-glycero-D-manno-heptose 1,7-bisphosphate phosphatase